jgi:hypothetical protein
VELAALVERRKKAAAEKAEAKAAAEVAACEKEQKAQDAKAQQLREIEQQVKAFYSEFQTAHGRKPKQADLETADHRHMKVLVERYQQLKHGIVPKGLSAGRDRKRAA